jgi:hypothetical protein
MIGRTSSPASLRSIVHRVFLALDLREVLRRVDEVEFAVDVDLPELINQQHRRVAI